MPQFDFRVTFIGEGEDAKEAWLDAIESFSSAPGPLPDDYDIYDLYDLCEEGYEYDDFTCDDERSSVDGIE